MATKTKSHVPARVSPWKAKAEHALERAKSAGKRLSAATKDDDQAMVQVGTALVLAVAESKTTLPTVGGVDPAVLYGALGYGLLRKNKSKSGIMAKQASVMLLGIGANRSYTRGSIRVGEDEDDSL